MTDKEIEQLHNHRHPGYDTSTSCKHCWFYSVTPHRYKEDVVFHNCSKFVSAGYAKPAHPDYTCNAFTTNDPKVEL